MFRFNTLEAFSNATHARRRLHGLDRRRRVHLQGALILSPLSNMAEHTAADRLTFGGAVCVTAWATGAVYRRLLATRRVRKRKHEATGPVLSAKTFHPRDFAAGDPDVFVRVDRAFWAAVATPVVLGGAFFAFNFAAAYAGLLLLSLGVGIINYTTARGVETLSAVQSVDVRAAVAEWAREGNPDAKPPVSAVMGYLASQALGASGCARSLAVATLGARELAYPFLMRAAIANGVVALLAIAAGALMLALQKRTRRGKAARQTLARYVFREAADKSVYLQRAFATTLLFAIPAFAALAACAAPYVPGWLARAREELSNIPAQLW
jgi:hypothetical protein